MRRVIPPEDCIVMRGLILNLERHPDYLDGVYCECGVVIYFKNRKPYEPVTVICPRGEIMIVAMCDRCRKTYDPVNRRGERDLVLRVVNGQVVRKRMSNGNIVDLCPSCYSELKQWFDSSAIEEP